MPLVAAKQATPKEYRDSTLFVECEHSAPCAATYLPLGDGVAVVLNTLVVTRETAPIVAAWAASLREDGRRLLAILDAEGLARGQRKKAG